MRIVFTWGIAIWLLSKQTRNILPLILRLLLSDLLFEGVSNVLCQLRGHILSFFVELLGLNEHLHM